MLDGGAALLADSRVENLRRLRNARVSADLMLLRSPQPSMARDVVRWSNASLNSDITTVQALGREARELGIEHGVILMVDLGDRREGVMPEHLPTLVNDTLAVDGVKLEGVGTNLACYGGVIPTSSKMERLVKLVHDVEQEVGVLITTVSGGNSANIPLQMDVGHPAGVTQLRLGESILLGLETVNRTPIGGTHQDAFKVVGELVEVAKKPSLPDGTVSQDAFGNEPLIEDRGDITEGVLALGRQDVDPESLQQIDEDIEILGASSDHLILDLGDGEWSVGDEVGFIPGYGSLLRSMTSAYVEKTHI
jgi:predicted amino acid racemase